MNALNSFFILAGLAGLIQVCFLPGWIVTHFLKLSGSRVWRLIASFGLSLMVNYWIIFILASLHIYTRISLTILICIELIVLFFISRVENEKIDWNGKFSKLREVVPCERKECAKIIVLALTAATFGYLVFLFFENIGTVFKLSDAVLSWNRWAVEWSTNTFPKNTWEYPQLVPVNWSLMYVLVGLPLEFLAKMIMPLFPLSISLALFAVGIKKKSWAFIISVPATILLMRLMVGSELMATEGYVDTAVTFFGLFSILNLLWSDRPSSKDLLVGALFAAGSAMTKQAGLFIVIIYPILAWVCVIRHDIKLRKKWLAHISMYLLLLIVLAGPFYIYKELSIKSSHDISVVPAITAIIYGGGKTPIAVSTHALFFLIGKTHGLILLYLILLIIALRNRKYRWQIILGAILYSIIWSVFNSYDTRNLTLSLPFWGMAAGLGLERMETPINIAISKIKPVYYVLLTLILIIGVSPWVETKIMGSYIHEKRYMIDVDLSVLLNNYFETAPDQGKIYTDYTALYFFPGFAERIYSPYGGFTTTHNDFDTYKSDSLNPNVSYILAAFYTDKSINEDIEDKIRSGQFKLIFRENGNVLVKTNNK